MAEVEDAALTDMLESGWTVAGYSVCLMAMGATSHHILLQHGSKLTTHVIVINNGAEVGRAVLPFAPAPPKKKGWFG